MRNVWFGAVIKALSSDLSKFLKDVLSKIHPMLRVSTDPVELYCAIDKCFAKTKNYAKGYGLLFKLQPRHASLSFVSSSWWHASGYWVWRCNGCSYEYASILGVLNWQLWYKCRQYSAVQFISHWKWLLRCKSQQSFTCQSAYLQDGWFEIVKNWRMQTSGVFYKCHTVDLMESAFALHDSLLLNEEFMMNNFEPIVSRVNSFAHYLQYTSWKKDYLLLGLGTVTTSGCLLMSCVQNCFIWLQTISVKLTTCHVILRLLLQMHSLLS